MGLRKDDVQGRHWQETDTQLDLGVTQVEG